MRVLYWSEYFWPYIGGIEILGARFLPAMRERGYEFTVITSHGGLELPDQAEYQRIPVHRFPFWQALAERDAARLLQIGRRIAELTRELAPHVVHVNACLPSLFFWSRTAAECRASSLIALRGTTLLNHSQGGDTLFARTAHVAGWVSAVSLAELQDARRVVPEINDRSSVIYNGLEPPTVACAPLSFDPTRLLCVGRLVAAKGFDVAVTAFATLVRRYPDLRLVIAGDGRARSQLEQQVVDLGLSHAVEFTGWVAPDKIPQLMSAATIVVIPSRHDGLPGVAIQAAQMARPVVATRVGGLPEVVAHGETGVLVENDDSDALAAAIAEVMEHPEATKQMGEAARARAHERFGWSRYLDDHDALYRRLSKEVIAC